MKSPFVVLSRLKLLLGIVLCLAVLVFPVYGAEFVVFQSELLSSPLLCLLQALQILKRTWHF